MDKITTANDDVNYHRYALVCGLQYERFFRKEIKHHKQQSEPLFRFYPDSQIAWAGPWLIMIEHDPLVESELLDLANHFPAVSWLTSSKSLEQLVMHLASQLNIDLADGRVALLRFYDPRVMRHMKDVLTAEQRDELLTGIITWHFSLNGQDFTV